MRGDKDVDGNIAGTERMNDGDARIQQIEQETTEGMERKGMLEKLINFLRKTGLFNEEKANTFVAS